MDNPNLDNVIGSILDDGASTSVAQPVADQPKQQDPVQDKVQDNQVKSEPQQDSFTKLDPNSLPDEVKPFYKSLVSDYTKKRQAESQVIKDLRAELEALKTSQPNPVSESQSGEVDPIEQFKEVATKVFTEQQEAIWDKTAQTEYPNLDDRLNENSPMYDEYMDTFTREKLTNALDEYIEANGTKIGFDYKSQVREIAAKWDEYLINSNKAYIQRQNEIVKQNSDKAKRLTPTTNNAPTKPTGNLGIEDAILSAFNGA